MSTSRYFRLTDELVEKYKPYTPSSEETNDNFINQIEIEILIQCMSNNKDNDVKHIFDYIKGRLWMYKTCVEQSAQYCVYRWYKEDEDQVLTIYGHREKYSKYELAEETNSVLRDLVLISKLVDAGDYFESESHFFDLKSEIEEKLEYLKDVYFNDELNQIMEQYSAFELTDDDFDDFGELKVKTSEENNNDGDITFDSLD